MGKVEKGKQDNRKPTGRSRPPKESSATPRPYFPPRYQLPFFFFPPPLPSASIGSPLPSVDIAYSPASPGRLALEPYGEAGILGELKPEAEEEAPLWFERWRRSRLEEDRVMASAARLGP
jgi:hypothetical protein